MGALTLKSFPFEVRGWDIEKFESFDPTDSFGSNVRVYINKNQIVLIEPDFNIYNFNTWITDKARQFFDGIFKTWTINDEITMKNKFWIKLFHKIIKTIYIFEHCNKQHSKSYFFTIVIGNLSNEILSFLILIAQNYSFIKLRKAENWKINTDLESNFQLNDTLDKIKLNSSTLCLLISTNPRYEGYYLNLTLRQKVLKGNFKCFIIGSLMDLTFPIFFLGSNTKIIKNIAEGNNFICQNLNSSTNPFLIYNNELSKRNDSRYALETLKTLFYSNVFNKTWNGSNVLNASLTDTGQFILKHIPSLKLKDLSNFSSLYFLNVTLNNISNLKRIIELKLLKFPLTNVKKLSTNQMLLDQNSKFNPANLKNSGKIINNYLHIPNTTFYENAETFTNTEGFIKRTTKLISRKKTKNNWQILRKLLKHIKTQLIFLTQKENNLVFFNSQKFDNFKHFINFQYCATRSLTHLNFYLNVKNRKIILTKLSKNFKPKTTKFINTKLKYWLDNFYTGGRDEYSQNSVILNNCSKILRLEATNFF